MSEKRQEPAIGWLPCAVRAAKRRLGSWPLSYRILGLLLPALLGGATLILTCYAMARGSPARGALSSILCPKASPRILATSQRELESAVKCAGFSTTIVLKPGNYGTVTIPSLRGVTITSEDAGSPATFERLTIESGEDIALSHLRFAGVRGVVQYNLDIWNARRVRATDLEFRDVPGGPLEVVTTAITLQESQQIELRRLTISGPTAGISFNKMTDLVIADSSIQDFLSDGIIGTASSRIVISGNHIMGGHPRPGDHPDAIQFFTTNSKASAADIVIKDNLIERGEGDLIQGIFMGEEAGDRPYRDVRIEGNLIIGSMYHGIMLGSAVNATVTGNIVIPSAAMQNWIFVTSSPPLVFSGNVAQDFIIDKVIIESGPLLKTNRKGIVSAAMTRSLVEAWKAKNRPDAAAQ